VACPIRSTNISRKSMHLWAGYYLLSTEPLYEGSMATAIQHNFFRPMVPGNADILLSGNARAENPDQVSLDPQGQHLACFTGGMLALGSRLFSLPDHLDIARKLVDGCIMHLGL
jgi:mannosyl-oligosaccharide alpha-1,2-mannosidase